MKKSDPSEKFSAARDIAIQALVFIAADEERLGRFLAFSGIDPASIRQAAQEPGFLAGVLEHLSGDENLLLRLAEQSGLRPEQIASARALLAGPGGP
jgi:hypothetical protein